MAPATVADGQGFVLVMNVEFNVAVAALSVPRVFASFRHPFFTTPLTGEVCLENIKSLVNRLLMNWGDQGESEVKLE